jgi:peptidoglycan/xylan/chitin deacetylase (PgdA/CDA1 family)
VTESKAAARRDGLVRSGSAAWKIAGAGLVVFAATAFLPPVHVLSRPEFTYGDMGHYQHVAQRIVDGQLPYRDFWFEYPPAAIPVILAPKAVAGPYQRNFRVVMWLIGAVGIALLSLVLAAGRHSARLAYGGVFLAALAPIPLADLLFDRYDLWPALLALVALTLLAFGRRTSAATIVGVGAVAKIYPLVLLPIVLLYGRRRIRVRELRRDLIGFALGVLLFVLPFLILNPPLGGLGGVLSVQVRRPLHIESLAGSMLLAADRLGIYHADVYLSFGGSQDLAGGLAKALAVLGSLTQVLAVCSVWFLFGRTRRGLSDVTLAAAAAIVAFVAFGKVFSPQYVIWLILALPLVAGPVWFPTVALGTAAVLLTRLYYPERYSEVVAVGNASWIVLARNLTLVVLFGVLLRSLSLRTRRGAPSSPFDSAVDASCFARGASSLDDVRADPSLLPQLQIGRWFDSSVGKRVQLRVALAMRSRRLVGSELRPEAAFWAGVRSRATRDEWRRLTKSSYVVLYYHRLAGARTVGQERLDVSPARFRRQMRLLRVLGWRPLTPPEILAFHADPHAVMSRRRYVVTADDGYRDAVQALAMHAEHQPEVFVPTAAVGGSSWWIPQEEAVATWDELRGLERAGGWVGSHTRRHSTLTELDESALESELVDSRADLEAGLTRPIPFLAYPHGRHDDLVRSAAAAANYRAAYTTEPGRNGAGTDPFRLRRIGPKDWDSSVSFLWKAVTGELVPPLWEEWRRSRRGYRYDESELAPREITES